MADPQKQMDLLLEDGYPLETLNYVLKRERERGQEHQQRISSSHIQFPQGSGINLIQRTRRQPAKRNNLTTPTNNNKIADCWKFEYNFSKGHLDICPAKNTICNICKKIGADAKVCRSEIPPRRSETQTQNIQRNNQNYNYKRTQRENTSQQQIKARRLRNIKQSNPDSETIYEEVENETETMDPECTCYIREMMGDWTSINFIQSLNFTTVNKTDLNKNQQGQYWLENLSNNEKITWLVDKGSPRSFISQQTAKNLTKKLGNKFINTETNIGEFRCFNNNKIQVDYTIQLDLVTRNTKCQILVVPRIQSNF